MRKPSSCLKSFTALLSALYFLTNCALSHAAQTNVWEERRKTTLALGQLPKAIDVPSPFRERVAEGRVRANAGMAPESLPLAPSLKGGGTLPIWLTSMVHYGTLRKIHKSKIQNPKSKIIIHIQDIHQNDEAQKNISRLVQELVKGNRVGVVALEGAFEPIDLTPFHAFPDQGTVREVADHMLSEKKISGAAHALMTVPSAWCLVPSKYKSDGFLPGNCHQALGTYVLGIDDPIHYRRNVNAYLASRPLKKDAEKELARLKADLARAKEKTFHRDLIAFDRGVEAHRSGDLSFGEYVSFLSDNAPQATASVQDLLEAYRWERTADFKRLETERARLLEELVEKLDASSAQELTNLSLAFKKGEIQHADFYSALEAFCEKKSVPLSRYPRMKAYVRYVTLAEAIDAETLLRDVRRMEEEAYATLARSNAERRLIADSRRLHLTGKLLDFALTREEWEEYGSMPHEACSMKDGHHASCGMLHAKNLSPFERFYEEAQLRDEKMAENLLTVIPECLSRGSKNIQRLDSRQKRAGMTDEVAVLVTGGFHSAGIDQRLTDAGYTVITFVPKITRIESPGTKYEVRGTEYLTVFSQEKTPLEKLFSGDKLFLADHPASRSAQVESAAWVGSRALMRGTAALSTVTSWFKTYFRWFNAIVSFDPSEVTISVSPAGNEKQVLMRMKEGWLLTVTVVMPVIETLVMTGAKAFLQWYAAIDPASRMFFWCVVLSFAVIFSLAHPDLYDASTYENGVGKYGWKRWGRFFFRALMGGIYTALLFSPHGFEWSIVTHAIYNVTVAGARLLKAWDWEIHIHTDRLLALIPQRAAVAIRNNRQFGFSFSDEPWRWSPRSDPLVGLLIRLIARLPLTAIQSRAAPKKEIKAGHDNGIRMPALGVVVKHEWVPIKWEQEIKLEENQIDDEIKKFTQALIVIGAESDARSALALKNYMAGKQIDIEGIIRRTRRPAAWILKDDCERLSSEARARGERYTIELAETVMGVIRKLIGEKEFEMPPLGHQKAILVVKYPDTYAMKTIIHRHRDHIAAVLWDLAGEQYRDFHWAAVNAQAYGIPVLGVNGDFELYRAARPGTLIGVGGMKIESALSASDVERYRDEIYDYHARNRVMSEWVGEPVRTQDGIDVPVSSVLSDFPDFDYAEKINDVAGGDVGLFRTEFLYAESIPDDEFLIKKFRATADVLDGSVDVRAIDRKGGDKDDDEFRRREYKEVAELSPVRRLVRRIQLFFVDFWYWIWDRRRGEGLEWLLNDKRGREAYERQSRILSTAYAASEKKNLRFFVPMVRTVNDCRRALAVFNGERDKLLKTGIDSRGMKFGVMIETPQAVANIEAILRVPGVDFISLGTRDLAEKMKSFDAMNEDYLRAVKKVVLAAAASGKQINICGRYALDPGLILFVNSLPFLNPQSRPRFSIVASHLPESKAFIRSLDTQALELAVQDVSLPVIERLVQETEERMNHEIRQGRGKGLYVSTLNHLSMSTDARTMLRKDFSKGADPTLEDLEEVIISEEESMEIPIELAKRVGGRWGFINLLGRLSISAKKHMGTNGNEMLKFLARIEQDSIDKLILGNELYEKFNVVLSEGRREGKGQSTLPVGSELGFGEDEMDTLLLSMENSKGLYSPVRKLGTLVARVFAKKGSIRQLPDAYMFKVVVAEGLGDMDLPEMLKRSREFGTSRIDQTKIAEDLYDHLSPKRNGRPAIGVVFRHRHRDMIEALRERMGLTESFEEIEARVRLSSGRCMFEGERGTLIVSEDDDWSEGLRLGQEESADAVIGISGTPETTMSAVLVKKLGGRFAGIVVPHENNEHFSERELATMKRYGLNDPSAIYNENDLVPGHPDDIACMIGVISDFELALQDKASGRSMTKTIPGVHIDDSGKATAHVLLVHNRVIPVGLVYRTSIQSEVGESGAEKQLNKALQWAAFGQFNRSLRELHSWTKPPNADPGNFKYQNWVTRIAKLKQDIHKFEAAESYAEAGQILLEGNGEPKSTEEICLRAIQKYEVALAILRKHNLDKLREQMDIERKIRRIYYGLRNAANAKSLSSSHPEKRKDLFLKATRYSAEAVKYARRGFETFTRHNALVLRDVVSDFRETAAKQKTNDLTSLVAAAYASFCRNWESDSSGVLSAYAKQLQEQGSHLWTAVLYATVLTSLPLELNEQAGFLRFLRDNSDAKLFLTPLSIPHPASEQEVAEFYGGLISKWMKSTPSTERTRHARPRVDRVMNRETLERLIDEMDAATYRKRGEPILREFMQIALAKADIMSSFGQTKSEQRYSAEAQRLTSQWQRKNIECPSVAICILFYLAILWRIERPESLVRPGYIFEITVILGWIGFMAPPVSAVFQALAAFAALHVLVWMAARGLVRGGPEIPVTRFAAVSFGRFFLHLAGFLPYLLFAYAVNASPQSPLFIVLSAVAAAVNHSLFDEQFLANDKTAQFPSPKEHQFFDVVQAAIAARDPGTEEAPMSFEVVSAVEPLRKVVRKAIRSQRRGPVLIFVNDGSEKTLAMVRETFAEVFRRTDSWWGRLLGRSASVGLVIAPGLGNDNRLNRDLQEIQNEYQADVPSARVELGWDIKINDEPYSYEELFAVLADKFQGAPALQDLYRQLSRGEIPPDCRIVQVNTPSHQFIGGRALLNLILLVMPTPAGAVLLDFRSVSHIAQMA